MVEGLDHEMRQSSLNKLPFFLCSCLLSVAKYILDKTVLDGFGNFFESAFKAIFIVMCKVFQNYSVTGSHADNWRNYCLRYYPEVSS